jgi:activator of HSP90 ATPase
MNTTRRRALATIGAIAATSLIRAQAVTVVEKPATDANKTRTSIHYELEFNASPQRFYLTILDEKQFGAFTGMAATIDPAPGGAFNIFGGLIVGRTIELIPDRRIIQAWRATHWDPGVYSIIHFELKDSAAGTALTFDHTGFPPGEYDSLDVGWQSHYWEPLKKFFAEKVLRLAITVRHTHKERGSIRALCVIRQPHFARRYPQATSQLPGHPHLPIEFTAFRRPYARGHRASHCL